jgi:hypothetical protein
MARIKPRVLDCSEVQNPTRIFVFGQVPDRVDAAAGAVDGFMGRVTRLS